MSSREAVAGRCTIVRETSSWGDEALYDHLGRLVDNGDFDGIAQWHLDKHGCTEVERRTVDPDELQCRANVPPEFADIAGASALALAEDGICWSDRLDALRTDPA